MQDTQPVHITDVDTTTITVGDLVEQSGETYRVTEVRRSPYFNGVEAIYYVWTGSQEPDTYRSIVNSKDAVGQIRWESPYRKPVVDNGYHVTFGGVR